MKTLTLILVAATITITLAGNLKIFVYNTQLNQTPMPYAWVVGDGTALEITYMDSTGIEQVIHAQRFHAFGGKITIDAEWIVGFTQITGVQHYSIQEVERIKFK